MKTKVSKSEVMTKAWSIFKNCRDKFSTFSKALERAWEVVKLNVASRTKQREIEESTWVQTGDSSHVVWNASSSYGCGRYNGD